MKRGIPCTCDNDSNMTEIATNVSKNIITNISTILLNKNSNKSNYMHNYKYGKKHSKKRTVLHESTAWLRVIISTHTGPTRAQTCRNSSCRIYKRRERRKYRSRGSRVGGGERRGRNWGGDCGGEQRRSYVCSVGRFEVFLNVRSEIGHLNEMK